MPGGLFWLQFNDHSDNASLIKRLAAAGNDGFGVFHDKMVNTPPISKPGPQAMREAAERLTAAFDNLEIRIEAQFDAGEQRDHVATVWRLKGKLARDMDLPIGTIHAHDGTVELQLITVARIEAGRVVERWGQA